MLSRRGRGADSGDACRILSERSQPLHRLLRQLHTQPSGRPTNTHRHPTHIRGELFQPSCRLLCQLGDRADDRTPDTPGGTATSCVTTAHAAQPAVQASGGAKLGSHAGRCFLLEPLLSGNVLSLALARERRHSIRVGNGCIHDELLEGLGRCGAARVEGGRWARVRGRRVSEQIRGWARGREDDREDAREKWTRAGGNW